PGGGRLELRFEGVSSGAEVFVNGHLVAEHEGGATPFEADVTDVVHEGENVLALRVREHTLTSDELDKMSQYADFPLAGIMRPGELFRVPEAHVGAIAVTTSFTPERDAVLGLAITLVNESSAPLAEAWLQCDVNERASGRRVAGSRTPVALGAWERTRLEVT